MDAVDDATLLRAIAQARDGQAFDALYRRHATALYGLAMHITRSQDKATEAVQEAMLRVWKGAALFEAAGAGSARSWLLKIAARESLKVLRTNRKSRAKKEYEMARASTQLSEPPVSRALEQQELLTGLRRVIDGLPDLQRNLVTLHYAAGMTHQEIGDMLEMPRRTVSAKLEDAVGRLRQGLAGAGVAVLWPGESLISEAICGAHVPPPYLHSSVLQQLTQSSARMSRCVQAPKAGSFGLSAAVATAAACSLLGVVVWISQAPAQSASNAALVPVLSPQAKPAPDVAPPPAQQLLKAKWTFEGGAPEDILVLNGAWKWVENAVSEARRPAMVIGGTELLKVVLPPLISAENFCVKFSMRPQELGDVPFTCKWVKRPTWRSSETRMWRRDVKLVCRPEEKHKLLSVCCYIIGDVAVHTIDGKPNGVELCSRDYRPDRMIVALKNWHVEQIELQELKLNEIPPNVLELKERLPNLTELGWEVLPPE